jgi:hypothetical protein
MDFGMLTLLFHDSAASGVGPGRSCSPCHIGCHVTQETRVQNALDDVAGNTWQALEGGGAAGEERGGRRGGGRRGQASTRKVPATSFTAFSIRVQTTLESYIRGDENCLFGPRMITPATSHVTPTTI